MNEIEDALREEMMEPTVIEEMCRECQLDIDTDVPPPPVAICIGESPGCTYGNFSAAIGAAKSKKTFNCSAMVAAYLSGRKILEYNGHASADKGNVLYFDTEQSRYHAHRVFKRIATLSGLPNSEIKIRMKFCSLRKYSVDERIAIIEALIAKTPGVGLVIIDGIRDLMVDINSTKESTFIMDKLMRWTEENDLHIHTVIHQNKNDANARGHIGTEINNKAETVLRIEKDKNNDAVSTVEATYIRDLNFVPFAFQINGECLPELVEDYQPSTDDRANAAWDPYFDIAEATHRAALENVFEDDKLLQRGEMEEALKLGYLNEGITLSNYKIRKLVTFLLNKTMVVQVEQGRKKGNPYRYNPEFNY